MSVAMKITVYVPVWLGLGVQLKILVKESKVAPCGSPDAVKMILSPGSGSVAFTVNVMMLPALIVLSAGVLSIGGLLTCKVGCVAMRTVCSPLLRLLESLAVNAIV